MTTGIALALGIILLNFWFPSIILAGIKNVKQVSLGIQHIIADVIAKDSATLSSIKRM